ncbi:lipopolysaccharide heptosyltransferase family protein [Aquabacterium soli]|uniref:Lipopolysaccharide heptosyltransferase family protein n=1 Tax=Aquabacterium soli TaxID=2493092 RepID=A0A3R8YNC2_9BURK|nr:glycosyltransferase family 9 protein [Aquabacterium soli]RRS04372.1 lipopolysaccharide heptosyltransferase family protein [Aquabacterium soli]
MSAPNDNRPRTVVMLQYAGIGDLIWHVQYFKRVAETSQGGKVTVVAQPSTLTRAFIGHEAWIEAVIEHDHRPRRGEKRRGAHAGLKGMWRMAQQLRQGHFDRIILFSGRPSRGLVAWLSGIPVRMGFGYRWLQRIFLNKGPYIKAYRGDALAVYPEASAFMVAHGFCTAPVVPQLTPPAEQIVLMEKRLAALPRPLYSFAIGTSEPHKQWGVDKFAALAARLIHEGCGVLLIGGPAEVELAREIEQAVPDNCRHGLASVTDAPVLGSAAALRVADACVGNDTGMVNVAAAVGRPSYVIIGSRPWLNQDPENMHNIRARQLSDIDVDRVHGLLIQHRSPAHAAL